MSKRLAGLRLTACAGDPRLCGALPAAARPRLQRPAAAGGGDLSGEIAGAGATSQEAAQEAWTAELRERQLAARRSPTTRSAPAAVANSSSPAASPSPAPTRRSPKKKASSTSAIKRCAPGELIEVPAYVSPIAIIYNLPEVEALQLSPETLAKIFNQEITTWNDPAIAKDNPGVDLPDTRIVPVNRSDESGHDGELHRIPVGGRRPASGRTKSAATGRSRAARPPRAPRAWSRPSPPAKARSATPTPARPANSASPRSRSARTTRNRPRRPRRQILEESPEDKELERRQVHVRVRARPQDRTEGHLPDRPGLLR